MRGAYSRRVSLSVEMHEHGDIAVIAVVGELDLAAVPGFEAELLTIISSGRYRLVVDVEKLTFCDSTGLSAFVRGDRSCAAAGGWLRLAAPRGSVRRALEITGLIGTLTLDPASDPDDVAPGTSNDASGNGGGPGGDGGPPSI